MVNALRWFWSRAFEALAASLERLRHVDGPARQDRAVVQRESEDPMPGGTDALSTMASRVERFAGRVDHRRAGDSERGRCLPQPSAERATGLPTARCQSSLPVPASSACTLFCSVATSSMPELEPGARQ